LTWPESEDRHFKVTIWPDLTWTKNLLNLTPKNAPKRPKRPKNAQNGRFLGVFGRFEAFFGRFGAFDAGRGALQIFALDQILCNCIVYQSWLTFWTTEDHQEELADEDSSISSRSASPTSNASHAASVVGQRH
jgi:hypothetical protein